MPCKLSAQPVDARNYHIYDLHDGGILNYSDGHINYSKTKRADTIYSVYFDDFVEYLTPSLFPYLRHSPLHRSLQGNGIAAILRSSSADAVQSRMPGHRRRSVQSQVFWSAFWDCYCSSVLQALSSRFISMTRFVWFRPMAIFWSMGCRLYSCCLWRSSFP